MCALDRTKCPLAFWSGKCGWLRALTPIVRARAREASRNQRSASAPPNELLAEPKTYWQEPKVSANAKLGSAITRSCDFRSNPFWLALHVAGVVASTGWK